MIVLAPSETIGTLSPARPEGWYPSDETYLNILFVTVANPKSRAPHSPLHEKPNPAGVIPQVFIWRTPAAGNWSRFHLTQIMGRVCSTLKVLPQMVMSNPFSLIRSSVSAGGSLQ